MTGYRLSALAQGDLQDIHTYVAADEPVAADRLLDRLGEAMILLAEHPGTGRRRDELAGGLCSFTVAPYLIFYRCLDDQIDIVRVLHGARDYERMQF